MTIRELLQASSEVTRWLRWERESLEDFHAYAQRYSLSPGSNVYEGVLRDALAYRGLTLQYFRENIACPERDRTIANRFTPRKERQQKGKKKC